MSNIYVEDHSDHRSSLAQDLARHLYGRQWSGKVVVVTHKPVVALSALKKQWVRLTEEVRRARASTLKVDYIMEYDATLARLRHFHMTIRKPVEAQGCNVFFMAPEGLGDIPEDCRTVYLACPLTDEALQRLEEKLPNHALVVHLSATE
ncbi:hypothetical protein ACFUIY_19405 [Streptomyces griseorubiginosus]|uniref:hypothetical protein n=1 Tax=Streptomyces griseorubiginosus TaxID=67304 RepID=UPI00362880BE